MRTAADQRENSCCSNTRTTCCGCARDWEWGGEGLERPIPMYWTHASHGHFSSDQYICSTVTNDPSCQTSAPNRSNLSTAAEIIELCASRSGRFREGCGWPALDTGGQSSSSARRPPAEHRESSVVRVDAAFCGRAADRTLSEWPRSESARFANCLVWSGLVCRPKRAAPMK